MWVYVTMLLPGCWDPEILLPWRRDATSHFVIINSIIMSAFNKQLEWLEWGYEISKRQKIWPLFPERKWCLVWVQGLLKEGVILWSSLQIQWRTFIKKWLHSASLQMLHSLAGFKTQKSKTKCSFVKTGVLRLTTHQTGWDGKWDWNGAIMNLDAGRFLFQQR